MRDGYRVSSIVQGEWDASSIPREVWSEWVRFLAFLSPIHVSCFDCDYVCLLRLGLFPKGQGCHVVFWMDNDFRSVSSDVGCRVRLVNVFFSKYPSELDGLPYIRSHHLCWARGRSPVGAYFLVPGSALTKPGVWENCMGLTNLMLEVSTNCRNSERWVQS